MRSFFKTLFGDTRNVAVVCVVVLAETVLVQLGYGDLGAFVIPPLTLTGIAWLARG